MIPKKKSENFITLCILGPDAMHAGWSAMMRELNRKSKKHSETVRPNVDPQWRKQVTMTKSIQGAIKWKQKIDACASQGPVRVGLQESLLQCSWKATYYSLYFYLLIETVTGFAFNLKPWVTFRFQSFKGQIQRNGNHRLTKQWTVARIRLFRITSWSKHRKLSTERGNKTNSRNSRCKAA